MLWCHLTPIFAADTKIVTLLRWTFVMLRGRESVENPKNKRFDTLLQKFCEL